jgi:hypothetical protein
MSLTVQTGARDGVNVVAVTGLVDYEIVGRIDECVRTFTADAHLVVVELTDATLTNHDVMRDLARRLARAAHRVVLVDDRLAARRVLRRFGDASVGVFPSLDAALGAQLAGSRA